MFRRANSAGFDRKFAFFHHAVGNFFHHLLEQHAQMRIGPIVGRRDVFHAIGVSRELITFPKAGAMRVVRIVNRDASPPFFA